MTLFKAFRIAMLCLCACISVLASGLVYPRADVDLHIVGDTPTPEVEIYTTTYCGECLKAKAYLKANKIGFKEYNVQESRDLLKHFYRIGGKGVPLILIDGEKLEGFDVKEFESLWKQTRHHGKTGQ